MKKCLSLITILSIVLFLYGCDSNHKSEFYSIQRDDIEGYEAFIQKYPSSTYVQDARERIETEKERRQKEERERIERAIEEQRRREEEAEKRRIESLYGNNSLSNGAQPYSQWYGKNQYYDNYTPHSEIIVKAPINSDVVVIVRYNNMNGSVAGHRYIQAGHSSKIYLKNGYSYQTFFYYGKGWYPDKPMNKKIKGGFLKGEAFSKDGSSSYLIDNILTYELTLQENGNFHTTSSSKGEMF